MEEYLQIQQQHHLQQQQQQHHRPELVRSPHGTLRVPSSPAVHHHHSHSHSRSRRGRSRSRSMSRSRSRSRASSASSLDVDEMLLQASTTTTAGAAPGEMERRSSGTGSDGGFQHHRQRTNRMRPISPSSSSDILYSQRSQRLGSFSGEGGGAPPLLNSGVSSQQQTYQTHIFAPPVTGAPVKKSKFMPGSMGNAPPGGGNGNGTTGGSAAPLG
jgi:hypothetical protein